MKKIEINYKDISELKEFRKFDDLFRQEKCYGNNVYLYSRAHNDEGNPDFGKVYMWELVRGVYHKNPNGTEVHKYPSSSLWGVYGLSIFEGDYPNVDKYAQEMVAKKKANKHYCF